MSKKSPDEQSLIVPDPSRKTYIDEQGRKYWFGTGYHGRSIKMYGERWRFRTTAGDLIAQIVVFGLIAWALYSTVFGEYFQF